MMNTAAFAGTGRTGSANGQSAGGSAGGRRITHPLRPVSIKMLLDAQHVGDGTLIVDGRELGQAIVVGRVVEHETPQGDSATTAKFHGYFVSDGTGVMKIRHWLDASSSAQAVQVPVGELLRAIGTVKIFQDKPMITGTARQADNSGAIFYHTLEVVHTHLRLTRGDRDTAASPGKAMAPTPVTAAAPLQQVLDIETAIKKVVVNLNTHGNGVDVAEVANNLNNQFSLSEVRNSVRKMMEAGQLYQMDDGRFAL